MPGGKRKLVVCAKEYLPLLFSYKNAHPKENMAFLEPRDLVLRAAFLFDESILAFLMGQGMDYCSAKKWMRILNLGDVSKNAKAQALYDAIPKAMFLSDPLGDYELRHSDLYLLEMPEDVELHGLLHRKGIPFKDLSLDELGIEASFAVEQKQNVVLFQNKYEQFSAVFASIRQKMLLGEKADAFRVLLDRETDAFFVNLLAPLYGIKTRLVTRNSLYSRPGVARLTQAIYAKGKMELSLEEEQSEDGPIVKKVLEEFGLPKMPFALAYASLLEILKARGESHAEEDAGVICLSDFSFQPGKEVYLTCMQHGPFHNVYSDDDVLDDDALLAMGLNPSYVRTQLEKRLKRNYLRFHRFALLSRVKEHLDEKLYDSQFFEEGRWENVPSSFNASPDGTFTDKAARLFHMGELDRAHYVLPHREYRSYDSSFKGIKDYDPKKERWSVTNLETYISCPYRYYLNTVIPKAESDPHARLLGVLAHRALEGVYEENYDLDDALSAARIAYTEEAKKYDLPIGPYEELCIEVAEGNLRLIVPMIAAQRKHAKIEKAFSEYKVNYSIGEGYSFYGSIDAVLLIGEPQNRYYVLLDYKTGFEKFLPYECFLGASTQLPLYYYALLQEGFGDKHQAVFGGIGLKTVFAPNAMAQPYKDGKKLSLKKGYEGLCATGAFLDDASFWAYADDTSVDEKKGYTTKGSFFYGGEFLFDHNGEGNVSMVKGAKYSLEELVDDAVNATLATIEAVKKGLFPIAPAPSDFLEKKEPHYACSYCKFKDVCYHIPARDCQDYSGLVEKRFPKKGGE